MDDVLVKFYLEVVIGNVNYGFMLMKGIVDNELEGFVKFYGV